MIYFRARQEQRVDQLTNPPSCFSKLFSEHTASTMLGHASGMALTSGESIWATQTGMSPIMGVSYSRVIFFWDDRVTGTSGLAQQHILARTYVFKPSIFEVFCKHIERAFIQFAVGDSLTKDVLWIQRSETNDTDPSALSLKIFYTPQLFALMVYLECSLEEMTWGRKATEFQGSYATSPPHPRTEDSLFSSIISRIAVGVMGDVGFIFFLINN